MSIVHWNPWRELDDGRAALAERGSRLFTLVTGTPGESLAGSGWLPPVDITETEKAYRIDLEIPAVAAGDVNVSVKDGVLTVCGERKSESESEEGRRHRVERRWGKFSRSFRLPENVDEDAIEANSRDGVLYLTVAKKEKAQPRRIEVAG
jgi:HSP20 family protein